MSHNLVSCDDVQAELPEQEQHERRSIPPGEIRCGNIFFPNMYREKDEGLPFIQLSYDVKIEDAVNVMGEFHNLPIPRIILVVVSNISPLTGWKDLGQLKNFMKGIIKAVNTTEMWICTHGINVGITKFIGDAFKDEFIHHQNLQCEEHPAHSIRFPAMTLLGICREDLLSYADKLNGDSYRIMINWPVCVHGSRVYGCLECVSEENVHLQNEGNSPEENKFNLNPYHSHFIVVHDNTVRKAEINSFLLKFEKYLSRRGSEIDRNSSCSFSDGEQKLADVTEIPIIAVLVQGGVSSAQLILSHLQQQLPVVAIKGSGGLADLLAYTYYEVNRRPQRINDAEYIENILKPALSNKISHAFPYLRYNQVSRNLFCKNILECIKCSVQDKTQYLTILNIQDQTCDLEELPVHLLRALFKSQKTDCENWRLQMRKDLFLTVDWNCPNVAFTEVFQKDSSRDLTIGKKIFESALLKTGREEFVSIFLDQGFQVHKFLDSETLLELFRLSLQKEFFHTVCWEGILGYGKVKPLTKRFIDVNLNYLIEELTDMPSFINSHQLDFNSSGRYGIHFQHKHNYIDDARSAELRAITILIVWAVLSYRGTLAKTLWKHSDQPMNTALICSLMLQKLQPYSNDPIQQKEIEQWSEDFAEMATGVLDACYNDMPCRAYEALQEGHPAWSNHSSMEIAALAKNRTFMSHICCQKYLNNMFMGNIRICDCTWGFFTLPEFMKILLSALFIFPMYIWIRFKVNKHDNETKESGAGEAAERKSTSGSSERPAVQSRRSVDGELPGDHDDKETSDLPPTKVKIIYPSMWCMIFWMWSAPVTKFWLSQVFYMLFLALFSLDVLWPSCGNKYLDMVTFTWGLLIIMGDIRRFYILHKKYVKMPLFLKSVEIMYVIVYLFLFMSGRILGYGFFSDPYNGKVLLCLGLLYMYYRMIFIFLPISSTLGPLLFRTKRLVWFDFMNFMRMTALVLISNGIILQASIYPDYPITPELFRQTFHRAWISFFLTPVTDFTKLPHCVAWFRRPLNATFCRAGMYMDYSCPNPGFWPYIFGIQFFVILKLILMTLLAALFSNTHNLLQSSSKAVWKYQRYQLVVDFSHRHRLPPPFNVISFLLLVLEALKKMWLHFKGPVEKKKVIPAELTTKAPSSFSEYSYWKHLAQEYTNQVEERGKEEEKSRKQIDIISGLTENIIRQRKVIQKIKGQTIELDFAVSYIQTYLETIKYRSTREEGQKATVQVLSRRSPYLRTKIQRFPVPDKYVAWEVLLLNYNPPEYCMRLLDFSSGLQPFVDVDVIALHEADVDESMMPVFKWNMAIASSDGVYEDRQSWITDSYGELITYKLDSEGLPQNPMGRTGMRGRGAIPRWGPNHYIYVIITRWKNSPSDSPTDQLEFIEMWIARRNDLSLPGGFVKEENYYTTIRDLFKSYPRHKSWESSNDMIDKDPQFLRSCVMPSPTTSVESDAMHVGERFHYQKIMRGYMDDPANTDQAWKEVELWHFHFEAPDNMREKMKLKMAWRLITEEVFTQLPPGQAVLLQDTIKTMNATVK